MANTDITLSNDGGVLVPSAPAVPVVSGDTVSFSSSDGSAVFLFFSPDATSILSPKPALPFPLPAGERAVFTFTTAKPGAYSVYFGTSAAAGPQSFPARVTEQLLLEISSSGAPPFTGPSDTMNPGH